MATNAELTNRYNELATQLGKPTIAPGRTRRRFLKLGSPNSNPN